MFDFYIFDLAVYRRTEEEYYADRDQSTARRLDASGLSRERSPDSYRNAEEAFTDSYGGPWEFNQVVGWIRLYVEASHVGAHLWWVNAKRLQSKMRKTFYRTTPSNVLATSFPRGVVSAEIFSDTLTHLEKLAKEKPLKGRYLDLETFRNIGPFINWRELLNNAARREESQLIEFFVPAATDSQQAEEVWQATKKFAIQSLGWNVTERRIFSITYSHEGILRLARVGSADPRVGELVIAIMESDAYLVCTRDRGVLRGEPILVGREKIRQITDFQG